MSRTFAYCRVSTVEQTTENQILEIERAGFSIEPARAKHRVVTETVSGSIAAAERPGFRRLVDRLEAGDVLVVTKLDRLGRDAIDVAQTVQRLADAGVRLHCLALNGVDLTSSAGRLHMHIINAVAQFERDLLIERTQAGLTRAKAAGVKLGRPRALDDKRTAEARAALQAGATVSAVAKRFETSRQTIMRVRNLAIDQ
jgi:putative DNA-invertase from lambdoid prophage Rac